MTKQAIVDGIRDLSTDEKLDLLYHLWDEIAAELESRPPTEAERRFLDDRLRDISEDGRADRPWQEVRDNLIRGS